MLPAHHIKIEFELRFDNKLTHGQRNEAALKPNEIRELVFTLPLDILEIKPTENAHLIIRTEMFPDITKTSFYHTDRNYSIPPYIKRLDEPFPFVFPSGGAYD